MRIKVKVYLTLNFDLRLIVAKWTIDHKNWGRGLFDIAR
jgi:hypothetical protein